jgi:hypothetical protein
VKQRALVFLILGFPLLVFVISIGRAFQLAREGEVPAEFRDLNCDGKVSTIEWLRAGVDLRVRPGKEGCTEVWHAKTGRTIVTRCQVEPRCRLASPPR